MTKAWLPKCEESAWWNIMWWIYLRIFIMLKDAKSCSMKPHVTRESLWKIHKRWKVRFGVTHLQVDRRKSSVGHRWCLQGCFSVCGGKSTMNLKGQWRVHASTGLENNAFFSRVVLPNSNYWSQGFEIKRGFHSSMYLEISQRCGYSLDNFWTWTEINDSNLKAVTFMNKKLSPFMVGRPLSSVISSSRLCMNFTFIFIYICCHFIHRSTGMALRLWVAEWMDLGPVFHEEHVSIRLRASGLVC